MPFCTCILGAVIELLANLEVASLVFHCIRGVPVQRVALKGSLLSLQVF